MTRGDLPSGSITSMTVLLGMGFSHSAVQRRLDSGQLIPVKGARGVYLIAGRPLSAYQDLLVAGLYAPTNAFCLLTALWLHQIRGPCPDIWLSIPKTARAPDLRHFSLKIYRDLDLSNESNFVYLDKDGIAVRVTSVAKTIVDCFKRRSEIGIDVAVNALQDSASRSACSYDEIWNCAEDASVGAIMLPYMEMSIFTR